MVLVDTSAWVEFFRHQGDLAVKLAVRNLLKEFEAQRDQPKIGIDPDLIPTWFNPKQKAEPSQSAGKETKGKPDAKH